MAMLVLGRVDAVDVHGAHRLGILPTSTNRSSNCQAHISCQDHEARRWIYQIQIGANPRGNSFYPWKVGENLGEKWENLFFLKNPGWWNVDNFLIIY